MAQAHDSHQPNFQQNPLVSGALGILSAGYLAKELVETKTDLKGEYVVDAEIGLLISSIKTF